MCQSKNYRCTNAKHDEGNRDRATVWGKQKALFLCENGWAQGLNGKSYRSCREYDPDKAHEDQPIGHCDRCTKLDGLSSARLFTDDSRRIDQARDNARKRGKRASTIAAGGEALDALREAERQRLERHRNKYPGYDTNAARKRRRKAEVAQELEDPMVSVARHHSEPQQINLTSSTVQQHSSVQRPAAQEHLEDRPILEANVSRYPEPQQPALTSSTVQRQSPSDLQDLRNRLRALEARQDAGDHSRVLQGEISRLGQTIRRIEDPIWDRMLPTGTSESREDSPSPGPYAAHPAAPASLPEQSSRIRDAQNQASRPRPLVSSRRQSSANPYVVGSGPTLYDPNDPDTRMRSESPRGGAKVRGYGIGSSQRPRGYIRPRESDESSDPLDDLYEDSGREYDGGSQSYGGAGGRGGIRGGGKDSSEESYRTSKRLAKGKQANVSGSSELTSSPYSRSSKEESRRGSDSRSVSMSSRYRASDPRKSTSTVATTSKEKSSGVSSRESSTTKTNSSASTDKLFGKLAWLSIGSRSNTGSSSQAMRPTRSSNMNSENSTSSQRPASKGTISSFYRGSQASGSGEAKGGHVGAQSRSAANSSPPPSKPTSSPSGTPSSARKPTTSSKRSESANRSGRSASSSSEAPKISTTRRTTTSGSASLSRPSKASSRAHKDKKHEKHKEGKSHREDKRPKK